VSEGQSQSRYADHGFRARLSGGRSTEAVHRLVAGAMAARGLEGLSVADVGCGTGDFFRHVGRSCRHYVGIDAVRYEGFPSEADFVAADLNDPGDLVLPGGPADVVTSIETIEHLENPRAFMRFLWRITKPGGWIFVTTPNQRSLLSLATLVSKGRFSQFQDVHYPAHITALLDVDLRRMAREIGLEHVAIDYSRSGRVVLSARHAPAWLSRAFPRALSDNVMLAGRRLG
jgi:2-polyprenyl-3-methyl-5-hydroxy-6-metoxy-1,4-benzoquinol methylase